MVLGLSMSQNMSHRQMLLTSVQSCIISVAVFYDCPQAFLSSDFHCRMDVSAQVKIFLDLQRAEGSTQ